MINRAGRSEVKFDFTLLDRDQPEPMLRTGLVDGRRLHTKNDRVPGNRESPTHHHHHQNTLDECAPDGRFQFDNWCKILYYWDLLWETVET